jgi:imidazole glycerol phosphate synthase glutamine amidotransferase subunit
MKPSVAILSLGAANRASLAIAIERAGGTPSFTDSAKPLANADAIVFPGVANFGYVARALDNAELREPLLRAIASGTPFLGICVGFQMLFEGSDETPGARGLGVFAGSVRALAGPKNPHMGWNTVELMSSDTTVDGWAYFAHSFAVPIGIREAVATTTYGTSFTSVARSGNVSGVQFHPERSGRYGADALRTFVRECEALRVG